MKHIKYFENYEEDWDEEEIEDNTLDLSGLGIE